MAPAGKDSLVFYLVFIFWMTDCRKMLKTTHFSGFSKSMIRVFWNCFVIKKMTMFKV